MSVKLEPNLFFLLFGVGLGLLFLLDLLLLLRFRDRRKKLDLSVTLPLYSLQNLERIRFLSLNDHLVRFAIGDNIVDTYNSKQQHRHEGEATTNE